MKNSIDNRRPVLDARCQGSAIGNFRSARSAFTLIEMMVVVAIIALLIAALLPAFGVVRTQARITQTQSMFSALETGLQAFRSEAALGNLPPSAADNPDPAKRQIIANPKRGDNLTGQQGEDVRAGGAILLAHAMIGADGLGPPGFKDLNRDGQWWNDTHDEEDGLYELDDSTLQPKQPRYGGAGYVDEKMKESMASLNDLNDKGLILNLAAAPTDTALEELMFTSPWSTPILYYRASKGAIHMVGSAGNPGVYWQEDNGIITGTTNGLINLTGLDFGAGRVDGEYHAIVDAVAVTNLDPEKLQIDESNTQYDNSFARFIWDRSVKARYTPVRKDSYLLISAGPDGRYGTTDDVTNWNREVEK